MRHLHSNSISLFLLAQEESEEAQHCNMLHGTLGVCLPSNWGTSNEGLAVVLLSADLLGLSLGLASSVGLASQKRHCRELTGHAGQCARCCQVELEKDIGCHPRCTLQIPSRNVAYSMLQLLRRPSLPGMR